MSEVKSVFDLADLGISVNENDIAVMPDPGEGELDSADYCGKRIGRHLNILTGLYDEFTLYCNDYRECKLCRKRRYNYVYARIQGAHRHCLENDRTLCLAVVNKAQARAIMLLLGSKSVFRIPQGDDVYIVLCDAQDTVYRYQPMQTIEDGSIHYLQATAELASFLDRTLLGKATTRATIKATISISNMVNQIPSGRESPHMSGNLGKVKKPKREKVKEGPTTWTVTHTPLLVDVSAEDEIAMLRRVRDELDSPHTYSQKAFQESVTLFHMRVKDEIITAGWPYRVLREVSRSFDPKDIEWGNVILALHKDVA